MATALESAVFNNVGLLALFFFWHHDYFTTSRCVCKHCSTATVTQNAVTLRRHHRELCHHRHHHRWRQPTLARSRCHLLLYPTEQTWLLTTCHNHSARTTCWLSSPASPQSTAASLSATKLPVPVYYIHLHFEAVATKTKPKNNKAIFSEHLYLRLFVSIGLGYFNIDFGFEKVRLMDWINFIHAVLSMVYFVLTNRRLQCRCYFSFIQSR